MALVSGDLVSAMRNGVEIGKPDAPCKLRLVVTGIKGDWPFLIECGHLTRHFRRAPKRGQSAMQSEGICHLCLAGYDGFPFTDVSDAPGFERTMCSAAVTGLKGLSTISFEQVLGLSFVLFDVASPYFFPSIPV